VGDPLDPATEMGPMISAGQRQTSLDYVAIGTDEGARLVHGGDSPTGDGYYLTPAVLADVDNSMRVAREEIFGPVIVVETFDDDEEAIHLANDSDFGLYDYVFSGDSARGMRVARRLRAGNIGINTIQRNHETPFGGTKLSGVGRDGGSFGLHAYSELQSVVWPG
jgi:acyl-CoA reductase-like NAD-dependent aldehyde dehydrogenase